MDEPMLPRCGKQKAALGYADALGRTALTTVTIVVVAIWNAVLLTALGAGFRWRNQVLPWITQLDCQDRNLGEGAADDPWAAFLAEHPELSDR